MIFVLTYLSYSVLHSNRMSFSQLKYNIKQSDDISSSMLGAMDTAFLAFYSIGLFVSGYLGDHQNPKWMLIISYSLVTVITTIIAFCGINNWMNIFFMSFLFGINGLL